MKKIIHIDLDAFYASVEQLDAPELRGKPVVVGGSPNSRGVVCAASYEARKFGVKSAIPCSHAYRLCPQAIFVKPRFERYTEISQKIREIFRSVTDLVEPLSLDEAYLDVTENKINQSSATMIAAYLRKQIKDELGLTASAGVAPVKFVAKIASDINKPDGLTVIPPEKLQQFVRSLPVEKLWSVGPATKAKLNQKGLFTAEDIRKLSRIEMKAQFGKHGLFLHDMAFGKDDREVKPHRVAKSRGAERTFSKDLTSLSEMLEVLKSLSDTVSHSLVKKDLLASTISIKVRYSDFQTISRAITTQEPMNESAEIYKLAEELLKEKVLFDDRGVRLLGISASNFLNRDSVLQLSLFGL